MSKLQKPLESGIYGVIGKPGSGKSYHCAKEILFHAMYDRRPVYTNIPIRLKKMRAYIVLKTHGPKKVRRALSKLIRPTLTKQHFGRFCERLSWISDRIEELKDEFEGYGDLEEDVEEELEEAFWKQALIESDDVFGEPEYAGYKANWFPPGSVLFLDEVHKWFPAKNYRDEPKYVLDMTSMHRHLQLKIFVVTQRWMNASLSFRSMATELIRCMNFARVPLLGPLRLHMFGLNLFRVGKCLPEDYDERNDELKIGKRDITYDYELPGFNGGIYFKLYKSHVHGGSLADQAKELREIRARLVGSDLIDEMEDKKAVTTKTSKKWQWFKYAVVFYLGAMLAWFFITPEKEIVEVEVPGKQTTQTVTTTKRNEPRQQPFYEQVRLSGVIDTGAYLGHQLVKTGTNIQGYRLAKVDVENGKTYWQNRESDVVEWTVGHQAVVYRAADRMQRKRSAVRTASQGNPAQDQSPTNPTQQGQN
ncbi:MAG: zonular occludens toxin domain-containing protein [Phycisphaeraceae bacterium JB051]